jgi:signal peptidase I
MFKVITLSDSNYFDSGKLFLQTRDIIKNHDVILYGPDLTKKQLQQLKRNNISYEKLDKQEWDTKMQFLKFDMILNELKKDIQEKYQGYLLTDWDVFFVNDWSHIYEYDFDLCIIVRPDEIKRKIIRAYGCGSGFFFKHSSKELFEYIQRVILNGGDTLFLEYDRIWKTLEKGRSLHKTHYRTTLRWWVDQVAISSIVLHFLEKKKYQVEFGLKPLFTDFKGFKIAFVSEKFYNVLNSDPVLKKENKNIFIRHLKESGRIKLVGAKKGKVKEKLEV